MKRSLAAVLAVVLMSGLAACSSGEGSTQTASSAGPSTPSQTVTPKPPKAVPDVAGKPYSEASQAMTGLGFRTTVAVGPDSQIWLVLVPGKDVLAVSTAPAGGTSTTEESVQIWVNRTEVEQQGLNTVASEAASLAARYEFDCGAYTATKAPTYHSYKEVWATTYYLDSRPCSVTIKGQDPSTKQALVPSEQALVDLIASKGGDVSLPTATVGKILLMCAKIDRDFADQTPARMDWRRADIEGALSVCPDAPHAAVLREALTSVKVDSGTKVVGSTMEPGTYKTKPEAKDCYWSRTSGGGDIIDNGFVGFAPDGVTVTVYAGEGFESERCGIWTKVG